MHGANNREVAWPLVALGLIQKVEGMVEVTPGYRNTRHRRIR